MLQAGSADPEGLQEHPEAGIVFPGMLSRHAGVGSLRDAACSKQDGKKRTCHLTHHASAELSGGSPRRLGAHPAAAKPIAGDAACRTEEAMTSLKVVAEGVQSRSGATRGHGRARVHTGDAAAVDAESAVSLNGASAKRASMLAATMFSSESYDIGEDVAQQDDIDTIRRGAAAGTPCSPGGMPPSVPRARSTSSGTSSEHSTEGRRQSPLSAQAQRVECDGTETPSSAAQAGKGGERSQPTGAAKSAHWAASPGSRASSGWQTVRAAVTRELHLDDSDLLRDVLVSPRGGTPLGSIFRRSRCCSGSRVHSAASQKAKRDFSSLGARVQAPQGGIGRWCCTAAKPTIPARNRGTVRSIVYRHWKPSVIDPECRFASTWKGVVFAAIICQAVLVPLRVGFDSDVSDPLWRPMRHAADVGFVILDLLFVADIMLSFCTGFIENGNKIMDRSKIRRRALLQLGFVLDVVAVIPYDILIAAVVPPHVPCRGLFGTRLTRLLRCRKLPRLFAEAEDAGGIHFRNFHQVFKILVFILLLVHFDACLWFRLSLERGFSADETGESFLAPQTLASAPFGVQYASSLYWAVRQATGEGIYGGPELNDALENAFSMFVTLSGILLTSFMIGAVARLVSQFDASWAQHSERLVHLHRFLAHSGLSTELGRDISAYYEFSFAESGGRNAKEVVGHLSTTLQGQLSVIMTHDILRDVPLFADVEEGLVVSLAKTLSSLTVQRGELVMRAGLRCRRVFLVHWGSLNVEVGGSGDVRKGYIVASRAPVDVADTLRSSAVKSPWAARLLRRAALTTEEDEEDDALRDDECRPGGVTDTLSAGSFFGQYVEDSRGFVPSTSVRANTFCILFALEHETLRTVLPRYPRSKRRVERFLARTSTTGAETAAHQRRPRRSPLLKKKNTSAKVVAAAANFAAKVQRRTPRCCSRMENRRVLSRTPCAWLVRDCCIRAASSSADNGAPRAAQAVSPASRLRSPNARLRPSTTRHTPSGGVVNISATPGRRAAKALPLETEDCRWWQAPDTVRGNQWASTTPSPMVGVSATQGQSDVVPASSPTSASFVLNPHSNFRWTWQTLMQLSVLYTLLTVPIYLAFQDALIRDGESILGTLDAVVNVMYLCDLLVRARMAAYSRGVLVTNPSVLLRAYITSGGFWKDAVSSVPLDWLFGAAWWTRINKLARASRLIAWFRTWLSELTDQSSSSHAVASTLLQLVFLLLMSFHYLTCVYWVFATASRDSEPIWHEDTFSAPDHLDDESVVVQYMYASYRVAHPGGLLRGVVPSTGASVLFALVITIYGLFLFAYVIGALGAVIADTDAAAAGFRRRKLAVERFFYMRRVPKNVKDLVSHWFHVEWQNHSGLTLDGICSDLPRGLQRRVRLELCGDNLRRTPVFATLNNRLLTRLAEVLRVEMLVENQVVFHAGELGTDLFVVVGGAVSTYFDEDGGRLVTDIAERIMSAAQTAASDSGPLTSPPRFAGQPELLSPTSPASSVDDLPEEMLEPFATVGPGDMGGEFAFFEGLRPTTAIAVCATEAYFISYDALHKLLSNEPFLEARLRMSSRRKLLQVAQIAKNIWRRAQRADARSRVSTVLSDESCATVPQYRCKTTASGSISKTGPAHGGGSASDLLVASTKVPRHRAAAGAAETCAVKEEASSGSLVREAEVSDAEATTWRPPSFADSGSLATVHFGDPAMRRVLDPLAFPETDEATDSVSTSVDGASRASVGDAVIAEDGEHPR